MPNTGLSAAHWALSPPFRRWFRMEVEGRGCVPGSGGVLLAANHRSFLDHFALSAACPRPPRFLGKIELSHGLYGRFNVLMGMVPVERGRADRAALDTVIELLGEGEVVGLFPEGTRSPTGGLHRFRSGLGRIAAEARAPVVPVGLIGMAEVWPRGESLDWRRRPAAGTLAVRFGDVLDPPRDDPRSRRAFTEECRQRVAELCGQPLEQTYAPIPYRPHPGS